MRFEVPQHILAEAEALTPEDLEGVDGVILGARIEGWYGDDTKPVAWGYLFRDRLMRFRDGDWIHTSQIMEGPDETGLIKTMNSVYRLKLRPSEKEDGEAAA